MKKYHKLFIYGLLLLGLLIFHQVFSTFLFNQELILIESNRMLSPSHIRINEENELIKERLEGVNFWQLREITYGHLRIYVINSDHPSEVVLPLNSGVGFNSVYHLEAVIGRDVKTKTIDGHEWVYFNGNFYKVTGVLGMLENSPLNNTMVLNDPLLFDELAHEVTIIDSRDASVLDRLRSDYQLDQFNIGLERMFQISEFLFISERLGLLLIFFVSIIIGLKFSTITFISSYLKYQMGFSFIKVVFKNFIYIYCFFLSFMFLIFTYNRMNLNFFIINDVIFLQIISIISISFSYLTHSYLSFKSGRLIK
ncbi:MAG: hypothetical protein FWG67_03980 [Defluviitaleaceae bacterium]|nr:hypothetical protein [Defluviitaleaceae bacterium]